MKKLPQLFYQSGVAWLLATWLPQAWAQSAPAIPSAPIKLRVVGNLVGLNLFNNHELPFWTRELPKLRIGTQCSTAISTMATATTPRPRGRGASEPLRRGRPVVSGAAVCRRASAWAAWRKAVRRASIRHRGSLSGCAWRVSWGVGSDD